MTGVRGHDVEVWVFAKTSARGRASYRQLLRYGVTLYFTERFALPSLHKCVMLVCIFTPTDRNVRYDRGAAAICQ